MSEIVESREPARERPVVRLATSGVVRYFLFLGAYVVVALRWGAWDYRGELPGEVYWTDPTGKVACIRVKTNHGARFEYWDLYAWRETVRTEMKIRSDAKPAIHGVLSELDGARLVALGKIDKRCFSSDGEFMLAREKGSREFAWTEVRTGRKLAKLPCGKIGDVRLAPDGSGVVVIDEDGAWVGCWDTRSDTLRYRIAMPGTTGMELVLSPCGKRALAVKRSRGRGILFDLVSGKVVRKISFRKESGGIITNSSPLDIAFSPCGSRVVGGVPDGRLAIWDAATGRVVFDHKDELKGYSAYGGFSFSSDRTRVAAGSWYSRDIIDLKTGGVLASLDAPEPLVPVVPSCAFADDALIVGRSVFLRRRAEWWWGHFYRPEVWAAAVFGSLWLWSVATWVSRNRRRMRREWRRTLCLDAGT